MSNEAAATGPFTTGSVTPPFGVLLPAGSIVTEPDVEVTATLPKCISTCFVMVIGVMMIAVAVAVAVAWAFAPVAKPIATKASKTILFIRFKFV